MKTPDNYHSTGPSPAVVTCTRFFASRFLAGNPGTPQSEGAGASRESQHRTLYQRSVFTSNRGYQTVHVDFEASYTQCSDTQFESSPSSPPIHDHKETSNLRQSRHYHSTSPRYGASGKPSETLMSPIIQLPSNPQSHHSDCQTFLCLLACSVLVQSYNLDINRNNHH